MPAYETVKTRISIFAGYDTETSRRHSDELIRGYVGERLANVSTDALALLDAELRALYDRALLRCEFLNQEVFVLFESGATPEQIDAVLEADLKLLEAAELLADEAALAAAIGEIERAFAQRDAAMTA